MAGGKAGTVEVDMPAGVLDMDGNRTGATVDDRCSNSISADARTTTEEAAAAALADSTLRPPKLTIATHSTYNDDVAYDGTKMASCAARQRPPAPLLFHADSGLGVASALKLSLDTQASLLKDSLSQPSLSHTSGGLGCNGGDDAVDRDGNDGNDDGELAIAPPATLSPAPFMRSFSVVRRPEELSIHPTSHSIPMDGTLENAVTSTVVADSASESHAVRHRQTQPRPQLWSDLVPRTVLLSISKAERKRQEIIFELVRTEEEYVRDLEILDGVFRTPLLHSDVIDRRHRVDVTNALFGNLPELIALNRRLLSALQSREHPEGSEPDNSSAVNNRSTTTFHIVHAIGDALQQWIDAAAGPYVRYTTTQVMATYILELEMKNNTEFRVFCEQGEENEACRRLAVQSFMRRPMARLGRYPLLLEAILNHTSPGDPDVAAITEAIASIREALKKVNHETGNADNALKLRMLHDRLIYKSHHTAVVSSPSAPSAVVMNSHDAKHVSRNWKEELQLLHPSRRLLRSGALKRKHGADLVDLEVFLLDTHLVLTRRKQTEKGVEYRLYREPIPLSLLTVDDAFVTATHDIHYTDVISISSTATPSAISADTSDGNSTHLPQTHHLSKYGFPFTIEQWGRDEQVHQFFVSTHGELRSWAGSLATAISVTRRRQHIFDAVDFVPERLYADDAGLPFRWSDVHCSLFFEDRLVVGTEGGVFCGRIGDEFARFELIVPRNRVVAVEVVPELNIVFVLADRKLKFYPVDILRGTGTRTVRSSPSKSPFVKGQRLGRNVAFFKVGRIFDRTLVLVIKTKLLATYIKVYDPIRSSDSGGHMFRRFFQHTPKYPSPIEEFKLFKEIYIPSESVSVHFLKTKLCVGCRRGFELIDILTLRTQALLDPADSTLDFALKSGMDVPLALFRVNDGEFLLCYRDYGIFVEKTGRNSRPHIKSNPIALSSPSITWMGVPVSFAYNPPHVIAYSANLVEVWDVECVTAAQVLPIANVRVVHCEHNIFLRGVPIAGALDVHQQSQASIAEDEADRVRVCELRRVGSDGNSEHGAIMVAGVAT